VLLRARSDGEAGVAEPVARETSGCRSNRHCQAIEGTARCGELRSNVRGMRGCVPGFVSASIARMVCRPSWNREPGRSALLAGVCLTLLLLTASAATAARSGWTIKPVPKPVGARGSFLNAVSCTPQAGGPAFTASANTVCIAVGSATGRHIGGPAFTASAERQVAMAHGWDGTRWSIEQVAVPADSKKSGLTGLSCTSRSACIAVGSFTNRRGTFPLIESWSGTRWAIQPTASRNGGVLKGVSCTSSSACTAVGSDSYGVLVERWDGSMWSIQPTPKLAGAAFEAVSCTSTSSCMAVGSASECLVESWNGSRWRLLSDPCLLHPSAFASLTGVSCVSPNACMAVGWAGGSGFSLEVAFRWNRSHWSTSLEADGPFPSGVSCISGTDCVMSTITSADPGLIKRWNGRRWATEARLTSVDLRGVSCTSAEMCMAVGSDNRPNAVSVLHRR
jgi:hypothetical protein